MPLGSTLFPPIPQPVNPPPGGMQLPSMSTFLAMSNLGENDTTSIPQANFSRNYNTTHDGFIDLTAEPASPTQPSDFSSPASPSDSEFIAFLQEETPPTQSTVDSASMPRQQVTTIQEPSRKRRRLNSGPPSPRRHTSTNQPSQTRREPDNFVTIDSPSREEPSEILDLTEVEGTNALHKVQEEQRERHVALQEQQNQLLKESVQAQEPENKGPFKLGQVQCVICMDNMTDMTATHCGHIFCHTCIMEALIAGENQGGDGKGLPRCPSCRTKVLRSAKGAQQVIPLALKFKTKSAKARGKERATA